MYYNSLILNHLCYDNGACEDYYADHGDHESNVILHMITRVTCEIGHKSYKSLLSFFLCFSFLFNFL